MIGLIALIFILLKLKHHKKERVVLVYFALILYSLFILLYQLSIFINYGTLTIGSDEQRYFEIIYNKEILSDSLFFPKSTSNTIYFWINYLYRVTSINDFIAILSLRWTNAILYLASYVLVVDVIGNMIKKTPKVTLFDLLYIFLPSSIYMFSRNLRDVYIIFILILLFSLVQRYMSEGFSLKRFLGIIFLIVVITAFRSGFLLVIIALVGFYFVLVDHKNSNVKLNGVRLIIVTFISVLFFLYFQDYFRNVMLVSSVYGFSPQEQSQIYQYSNIQLILTLFRKLLTNAPYLILEPSLINSIKFYLENDLSHIYMPIDYVLLLTYSAINQMIIFPMGVIAMIGVLIKKQEAIVSKSVLLVFILLVTTIYSSSIGSPDIRTKNFFIIPIFILIWSVSVSNGNFIKRRLFVFAFVVINILLIYFGIFF